MPVALVVAVCLVRVVGSRNCPHEVWVIFAVLAGTALFGLVGTFLATPVAAVIAVLVRFGVERWRRSDYFREGPAVPTMPPPPSTQPQK